MSFRQSIEDARPGDRRRLPLLIEVLSRRTLAPVDLFSFYIYMRDQQRSVDYLDFWLDVQQHLAICRHYVREIRRSALQELSENEKNTSDQSQLLEQIGDGNGNGESVSDKSQQQAISAILRSERGESATKNSGARKDSQESSRSYARTRSTGVGTGQSYVSSGNEPSSGSEQHHDSSPEHEVSRADIRAHAERILYTYLLPGAEREIILPSQILNEITEAIEDNLRDDPEVFDAAKEYVFLAMERDAFPGFLRARALGNMNPPHLLLRLVFGLISLFAGFWTSFTLVFLDYSHATRAWVVLPYWFGVYSLVSHQYTLDPLLAFVGYSEYTFGTFTRMREPFVISLLRKRAVIEMVWIVAIVAALSCIFIFVPGHRL